MTDGDVEVLEVREDIEELALKKGDRIYLYGPVGWLLRADISRASIQGHESKLARRALQAATYPRPQGGGA